MFDQLFHQAWIQLFCFVLHLNLIGKTNLVQTSQNRRSHPPLLVAIMKIPYLAEWLTLTKICQSQIICVSLMASYAKNYK